MDPATSVVTNIDTTISTSNLANPASFGEDAVGNLYYVNYGGGSVFKISTTQLLAGDYNADGTVDAADYTVWRDTLGQVVTAHSGADGDGSGTVDAGDYTVWVNNFGRTVHISSPGIGAAVPEPATAMLVFQMLGLCAILYGSRRRRATWRTSAF
jgi:hypothetical protein